MKTKMNIVKYGNRKLYCLEQSKYITLKEIYQLIKSGSDIYVEQHNTKADITVDILKSLLSFKIMSKDELFTFLEY